MNDGGDCRTAPATPGLLKSAIISTLLFNTPTCMADPIKQYWQIYLG